MCTQRFGFLAALALAMLVTTGSIAQEVPDTPEIVDPATASEAAPEPEPEPEAEPAEPAESTEASDAVEAAEPPGLLYEITMDFELVKRTGLEAQVGEIKIKGVEFGAKSVKGGVFGTSDADLKSTIIAQMECSTTEAKKQKISFTIEFLDSEGNAIDRARNNGSLKNESKFIEVSHTTLKYVVPLIKKVKITAEAKAK
jgi:hypothetical protein